jgi:Ribbon-helix-helix protein, copG family
MRRDKFVGVKLNESEFERLSEMMARTGRTASDVFRRMLTIAELQPELRLVTPMAVEVQDEQD